MITLTERDIFLKNTAPTYFEYLISEESITRPNQPREVVVSPAWLGRVKKRIKELAHLPANWDSYASVPVDPRIVPVAEGLLDWFAVDGMPPPDVFATSDGGVQIEWHIRRVNIEIEISPEVTNVYFQDQNNGEPWARPASSTDLQHVRRRLLASV